MLTAGIYGDREARPVSTDRIGQELVMKSCLVVDDSSVIRKVARRILEDLDFDVSEAEDGQQALDFCRQYMPDLILVDWNMPVVGGVEFLAALRSQFAGKKPKVVFCASENDVAHIARAMRAGADDYILKPFDREIVEAKLQEVGML
jgi:two-component system, chemotaxis family, chemotaxis protein CheY